MLGIHENATTMTITVDTVQMEATDSMILGNPRILRRGGILPILGSSQDTLLVIPGWGNYSSSVLKCSNLVDQSVPSQFR